VLQPQTVAEILQITKAIAGTCFVAANDADASPEEVSTLKATLDILHRQATLFNRRLQAQSQLAARPILSPAPRGR